MKNFAFAVLLWGTCAQLLAQSTNSLQSEISVTIEHVEHLDGVIGNTDLTGYNVFHVYAHIGYENFLHSILSWQSSEEAAASAYPISLTTDCIAYEYPSGFFLGELPCFLSQIFPEVSYDTYLTIGKQDDCDAGIVTLETTVPEYIDPIADAVCETVIHEGSITTPVGNQNGWADTDGKVLIAQITTCGNVHFEGCFEVYPYSLESMSYQGCATADFTVVYGCMDPFAFNYDPTATIDDGTCSGPVTGCTDNSACNFDPEAEMDNGTCELPGCNDVNACNYDPEASCFLEENCVFMMPLQIFGPEEVAVYEVVTYTVSPIIESSYYNWQINNGQILSLAGLPSVEVMWFTNVGASLSVQELNELDCYGPTSTISESVSPVSVGEQSSMNLTLFPNPASDHVFIQTDNPQMLSVTCFDLNGQHLFTTQEQRLDLQTMASGIYFLRIVQGQKTITKKLVVQ